MPKTYPEFYIKSAQGVYVRRKGGYDFVPGVQPAIWKNRATAQKWLDGLIAENPTAVIVDNTATF